MKPTNFIIPFIVLLNLSTSTLSGKTKNDSSSIIKPFAIGLHYEQFKIYDLDHNYDFYLENYYPAPVNRVVITINPQRHFRIEPELGAHFSNQKVYGSWSKSTGLHLGLGIFRMYQKDKLNVYSGVRIEYQYTEIKTSYPNAIKPKSNTYIFGPVIGGEYFLGTNFTIGAEIGLKYFKLKSNYSNSTYEDVNSSNFLISYGLFIRFYL